MCPEARFFVNLQFGPHIFHVQQKSTHVLPLTNGHVIKGIHQCLSWEAKTCLNHFLEMGPCPAAAAINFILPYTPPDCRPRTLPQNDWCHSLHVGQPELVIVDGAAEAQNGTLYPFPEVGEILAPWECAISSRQGRAGGGGQILLLGEGQATLQSLHGGLVGVRGSVASGSDIDHGGRQAGRLCTCEGLQLIYNQTVCLQLLRKCIRLLLSCHLRLPVTCGLPHHRLVKCLRHLLRSFFGQLYSTGLLVLPHLLLRLHHQRPVADRRLRRWREGQLAALSL